MTKAILGKTPQGKEIPIDVTRLLETRMLVTAASGNGKSRTLRRIAEQTAPLVQQFIFDPEGEFASLREKFDYVICAPSGADAVATPRTAALLARRLLESGVSAILDIYDLKPMERHAFVKNFLEAMINAPKDLWKPVLIILDEAHMFAPQNADCQSTAAVIDMATRGRKRGFCLMPATQRLSKLHKDVAAEMLNKMIGGIELDVDVKRASDDLGKTFKEGRAMLRNLDPGQFYIYGPALIRDITLVKVGDVITTHPGPGQRIMKAPPAPSARVMKLLGELADLPQQATEELKTTEDLRRKIAELQSSAAKATVPVQVKGVPESEVQRRVKEAEKSAQIQGYMEGVSQGNVHGDLIQAIKLVVTNFKRSADEAEAEHINRRMDQATFFRELGKLVTDAEKRKPATAPKMQLMPRPEADGAHAPSHSVPAPRPAAQAPVQRPAAAQDGTEISKPQQKILDSLAQMALYGMTPARRASVAAHAGVSVKSSGFEKNLSTLKTLGYIAYPEPDMVTLTDTGEAKASPPSHDLTLEELHGRWLTVISGPQQVLLRVLIGCHPGSMSRERLASEANVSAASSGFEKNVSTLKTLGAISYPDKGHVAASDLLFPEGLH